MVGAVAALKKAHTANCFLLDQRKLPDTACRSVCVPFGGEPQSRRRKSSSVQVSKSRCFRAPPLLEHLRRGPSQKGQERSGHFRTICAASETAVQVAPTEWLQKTITLRERPRGCHVVTGEIRNALGPEISRFTVGLANIFILHTSASLTINENASPDVPLDMADSLDRIVPEGHQYRHLDEGMDDMPAHVKGSLMGFSLTIPITGGRLNMGTWQGIYLNEHRNYGGPRKLCVTVQGQTRPDGRAYQ